MADEELPKNTTAPPEAMKDVNTWGTFGKQFAIPIIAAIITPFVGMWANWLAALLYAVAVGILWAFTYVTKRISKPTQLAIDTILAKGIPTGNERKQVADQLTTLDKSYKTALLFGFIILAVALLVGGIHLSWHWLTTKVPSEVNIATAVAFQPSEHKAMLTKAPFLEAVIGNLETEGTEAKQKYNIVLLTTATLAHPTPQFRLTIYYEQQAWDIAGYAFRRGPTDSEYRYEPVPVNYGETGRLELLVPACDTGDHIFVVGRLSLDKADVFPENLAEKTRTKVSPMKVAK